jgi:hypothetical protein
MIFMGFRKQVVLEILGMDILLPAMVHYRTGSGEHTAFCYINQMTGEVTVADEVAHQQELQKAILAYVKGQRRSRTTPPVPDEGFQRMDPKTYMNND